MFQKITKWMLLVALTSSMMLCYAIPTRSSTRRGGASLKEKRPKKRLRARWQHLTQALLGTSAFVVLLGGAWYSLNMHNANTSKGTEKGNDDSTNPIGLLSGIKGKNAILFPIISKDSPLVTSGLVYKSAIGYKQLDEVENNPFVAQGGMETTLWVNATSGLLSFSDKKKDKTANTLCAQHIVGKLGERKKRWGDKKHFIYIPKTSRINVVITSQTEVIDIAHFFVPTSPTIQINDQVVTDSEMLNYLQLGMTDLCKYAASSKIYRRLIVSPFSQQAIYRRKQGDPARGETWNSQVYASIIQGMEAFCKEEASNSQRLEICLNNWEDTIVTHVPLLKK